MTVAILQYGPTPVPDENGNPIPNAPVTIVAVTQGGSVPHVLHRDTSGVNPLGSNVVMTDPSGLLTFLAPAGAYLLTWPGINLTLTHIVTLPVAATGGGVVSGDASGTVPGAITVTKTGGVAFGTAATANKVAAGSAGVLDATDASTVNARTPTDGSVTTAKIASGGIATSAVSGLLTALGLKADLVGGLVPRAQLPNISGLFAQYVTSQAAMLALVAPDADTTILAVRTDTPGTNYWLNAGLNPSVLGNWVQTADDVAGAASAALSAAQTFTTTSIATQHTTDLTLFDGAGAGLAAAAGKAPALPFTSLLTADTALTANTYALFDCSAGNRVATLPTAPPDGTKQGAKLSKGLAVTSTAVNGALTTITLASAPATALTTGQSVSISGVTGVGATPANGTWIITVLTTTTFTVPAVTTGPGAGGTVVAFTLSVVCGGSDTIDLPGGATTAVVGRVLNQATVLQYRASATSWVVVSSDLPLGQLDLRYDAIGAAATVYATLSAIATGTYVNAQSNSIRNVVPSVLVDQSANINYLILNAPAGSTLFFPYATYFHAWAIETPNQIKIIGSTFGQYITTFSALPPTTTGGTGQVNGFFDKQMVRNWQLTDFPGSVPAFNPPNTTAWKTSIHNTYMNIENIKFDVNGNSNVTCMGTVHLQEGTTLRNLIYQNSAAGRNDASCVLTQGSVTVADPSGSLGVNDVNKWVAGTGVAPGGVQITAVPGAGGAGTFDMSKPANLSVTTTLTVLTGGANYGLTVFSNGEFQGTFIGRAIIDHILGYGNGWQNWIYADGTNGGTQTTNIADDLEITNITTPANATGVCFDSPIYLKTIQSYRLTGHHEMTPPNGPDTAAIRTVNCGAGSVQNYYYTPGNTTRPFIKATQDGIVGATLGSQHAPRLRDCFFGTGSHWSTRNDSCTFTAGSQTVVDANITNVDLYRPVYSPGVPFGAYVMSLTYAGTSPTGYVMSLPAWLTGTMTATIGCNIIEDETGYGGSTNFRADATATFTAGSAAVVDTAAVAADQGRFVYSAGIPTGTYILSSTPGTGHTLSAVATANGTGVNVATGIVRHFQFNASLFNPCLIADYTGPEIRWQNQQGSVSKEMYARSQTVDASAFAGAPTGAIAETLPQSMYVPVSSTAILTSGTMHLEALPLYPGDTVSTLTYTSGATALAGGTHAWAALLDPSRNLVGVSSDSTTWTNNTKKSFNLVTPYTASIPTLHYAALTVVGTTMPTIEAAVRDNVGNQVPLLHGNSSAGLTDPTTCPVTPAAPTYVAGRAYVLAT